MKAIVRADEVKSDTGAHCVVPFYKLKTSL